MPRGGSRPGAGRKPKKPAEDTLKSIARTPDGVKQAGTPETWPFGAKPIESQASVKPESESDDCVDGLTDAQRAGMSPLDYLLAVMRSPDSSKSARLQAAIQAAPYVHPKLAPGGKKDAKDSAARKAGAGKFGAAPPPKLVVNNRS